MKFANVSKYFLWALMGISLVLVGIFFFGGFVAGTEGTTSAEPVVTETILRWAYVLFIIAAAISLIFPIIFMAGNLRSAKRLGIVIVIAAVLIFISNRLADDQVLNLIQYSGPDNVPGTLKTVGTFLIFTYILGIVAILSILYSAIANLFR
jgi:formate-dependent nitrite reductase membrane component NrfD